MSLFAFRALQRIENVCCCCVSANFSAAAKIFVVAIVVDGDDVYVNAGRNAMVDDDVDGDCDNFGNCCVDGCGIAVVWPILSTMRWSANLFFGCFVALIDYLAFVSCPIIVYYYL